MPWDFERLTPKDLHEVAAGEEERREWFVETLVSVALIVANARFRKRPLQMADVMGPEWLRKRLEAKKKERHVR
jgi:hypothetical protein